MQIKQKNLQKKPTEKPCKNIDQIEKPARNEKLKKKLIKLGPWVQIAVGGTNVQINHYFDHGYLQEEKSMIYNFTVTFGAKYLTSMVTSVPPYGTFCLIKNNILHQSKNYKNHFENSNFRGM